MSEAKTRDNLNFPCLFYMKIPWKSLIVYKHSLMLFRFVIIIIKGIESWEKIRIKTCFFRRDWFMKRVYWSYDFVDNIHTHTRNHIIIKFYNVEWPCIFQFHFLILRKWGSITNLKCRQFNDFLFAFLITFSLFF